MIASTLANLTTADPTLGAAAVIGAFVALAMLLYRVADFLLTKYTTKHAAQRAQRCDMTTCVLNTRTAENVIAQASKINLEAMEDKVNKMYDWHNKTDADGVPVWYVRSSLELAIKELAMAIKHQNELFGKLMVKMDK